MRCAESSGPALKSMSTPARPLIWRKASRSVGTRSPAKPAPNHEPASRAAISASVIVETRPRPSVVRSTRASCMMTKWPSAVMRTSISMERAPISIALSKAASVFSGANFIVPRWPTAITGAPVGAVDSRAARSEIPVKALLAPKTMAIDAAPAASPRRRMIVEYGILTPRPVTERRARKV